MCDSWYILDDPASSMGWLSMYSSTSEATLKDMGKFPRIRYIKFIILRIFRSYIIDTLRPRQNGRHFADDIFKFIFLNENVWIPIKISLKFVPKGPINNIPALVQIIAWRRPGDKPLSEPMMVGFLTHICITRPQWDNNKSMLPISVALSKNTHESIQ